MTILVRDKDNHGEPMAMIATKTTTAKQIQEIIDDVRRTVDCYCDEDIEERLPIDCLWIGIGGDDEVWF